MSGDWLVIGVGNRDRGDDAVGPHVCDRLRTRVGGTRLRTVVCEGSIIDLALHWDGDDRVVVVDAIAPGARPGRIVSVDLTGDDASIGTAPAPTPAPTTVSTHEIDVWVAIELARALGRMPAQLLLIGIEAQHVAWAAPLSASVTAAADDVVDRLVALLAVGVGDAAG
jgi:hydrogenase maturation protease